VEVGEIFGRDEDQRAKMILNKEGRKAGNWFLALTARLA
jgi:hypothetical protein